MTKFKNLKENRMSIKGKNGQFWFIWHPGYQCKFSTKGNLKIFIFSYCRAIWNSYKGILITACFHVSWTPLSDYNICIHLSVAMLDRTFSGLGMRVLSCSIKLTAYRWSLGFLDLNVTLTLIAKPEMAYPSLLDKNLIWYDRKWRSIFILMSKIRMIK